MKKIMVTLAAFFPLSVLLGIIRRKYGLPAAMIFHSLNNIVVLSLNSVYVHYGLWACWRIFSKLLFGKLPVYLVTLKRAELLIVSGFIQEQVSNIQF